MLMMTGHVNSSGNKKGGIMMVPDQRTDEHKITMQAMERRHNGISATCLRSPEVNQEGVRPVGEFHCLGSVI